MIVALNDAMKNLFAESVKFMEADGTALANGNGFLTQAQRNAIVHAQVSAQWAYIYNDGVAEVVGNLKEMANRSLIVDEGMGTDRGGQGRVAAVHR